MFLLFLLFVILPIAEIMVLINVSGSIGGINTFLIVIVTAAFGAYFVRREGFSLLQKVQTKLAAGDPPGTEMAQGLLLLVAGVLLITPGFITDILGLLFTLPFSRAPIAEFLMRKVPIKGAANVNFNQQGFHQQGPGSPFGAGKQEDGDIIDGEYTDTTQTDDENRLN